MRKMVTMLGVAVLAWGLWARGAEGDIEMSYNLDSAIDCSQIVLEGEVTRKGGRDQGGDAEVRVKEVLGNEAGGAKVGGGDVAKVKAWENLEVGDHVFVLATARKQDPGQEGPRVWVPVTSGIYRERGGQVEVDWEYRRGSAKGMPVEEFRKKLEGALAEVKSIRKLLDQAVAKGDARGMVELLKRRSERPREARGARTDMIADSIGVALGKTQDFEAMSDALMIKDLGWRYTVGGGFETRAGVDYLLKKIGDKGTSAERRTVYIWALPYANIFYREPDMGGEARYLARVAQLALDFAGEAEVSRSLVYHLQWLPEGKDTRAAVGILQRLYKGTEAERVRHLIELICAQNGEEAFGALGSPCDRRLVVAAWHCDPTRFRVHWAREICVTMDYQFFLPKESAEQAVKVEVVAEFLESKKVYRVELAEDLGRKFGGPGSGTTTMQGTLPADAPLGRYREWVEFSVEGKSWGRTREFAGEVKGE